MRRDVQELVLLEVQLDEFLIGPGQLLAGGLQTGQGFESSFFEEQSDETKKEDQSEITNGAERWVVVRPI